ncbi:DUF4260 domain-containing protein [Mesorhizobium sp. LHD-90]|uniref:DUF4260 domain-containing protein n=1 Tax=Mesorhizobium sp. LHD-90 TaxID=3071414 RepID=UPI0027DEFD6B|nr:DUF4260 domain-containing protein [Mesorhizobium sp. LHD-90]MDQ6436177.1 DUF4260 domain-containing protein [Mesorhizobium sp. LHD-90]
MLLPRWMDVTLKLEWACGAVALLLAFTAIDGSWLLFAVLVLAPDLFMLGYLAGPRIGAFAYNLAHTLIGPVLLAGIGRVTDSDVMLQIALIWAFHVAVDRALGYGLKLPTSFQDTHLGRIGRG